LGLGEEGELEVQMLNYPPMPNRSTMFKVCNYAPFLPNPCYRLFFFGRFVKYQIIKQLNNRKMKKMIIATVCVVIVFVLCVHLLISSITTGISKEKDKYKVKIGQKFILEKDTLTIVDYSSLMENFKLSNDKEVNASLIFNNSNK
jgi:hypothetical protein